MSNMGPIGISPVLEHVVGERADGVEVPVGIGWIWGMGGKADGEMGKEKCNQQGLMQKSISHLMSHLRCYSLAPCFCSSSTTSVCPSC
jgi:hypothetical protein